MGTLRTIAVIFTLATLAAIGGPAAAQAPSVDALLARLFGSEDKTPYELTADFSGTLTLIVRGGRFTAVAAGSFHEVRKSDGVKRRKVNITRLDLPVLLRPFRGTLRRVIEEKVETQSESPETFHEHDIFVHGELPGKRYLLIGVQKEIVDEAIDRYGKPEHKKDTATRRRIAHWLYTSPSMREMLVRSGPPYALQAVLDEGGTLYELTLFYNWGEVGTRIVYIIANGQPVWQQVSADANSELSGLGRADGKLLLNFTNHCVNCKK